MATHVPDHNLACAFTCLVDSRMTEFEASLDLSVLNFSEPVIKRRSTITSFVSSYCETTNFVSVFVNHNGQGRVLKTIYMGIQLHPEMCSNLASSAAEVAFFTTYFPPPPLTATGHFVPANAVSGRTRLLKMSLVDSRLRILEPGHGQITYPSQVRYALLNANTNRNIAAGTLFVYVKIKDSDFPRERDQVLNGFRVPTTLVDNLRTLYPGTTGRYPDHIEEFLAYCELEEQGLFLERLGSKDLDKIIDILIVGIDNLPRPVLKEIYEIVGRKLDEFGEESLQATSLRLGFITN